MRYCVAFIPCLLAFAGPLIGYGWVGHGLYKIALFSIPLYFGLRPRRIPSINPRDRVAAILSGIILGGVAFGLLYTIMPLLIDPIEVRRGFDSRYGYTPTTAIIAAILIMSINALLEEWFYRGFLDDHAGVPVSVLAFGAQHMIVLGGLVGFWPAVLAGAAVMPAGAIWTWIARRSGSKIFLPWISHMLTDVVLLGGGLWMLGYL